MAIVTSGAKPSKPIIFLVKQPLDCENNILHYHNTDLKKAIEIFDDVTKKGALAYLCTETILYTNEK